MSKYNNIPIVVELGDMKLPQENIWKAEKDNILENNPSQTFMKNFFFSTDDTKIIRNMENGVWYWLAENDPEIVSTSQSMMVKDGKFHIVLTVFYKVKGKK